jgi:hypothetical protein
MFFYRPGTKEFIFLERILESGWMSGSMVNWSAPIDGVVITKNMTNDEMWYRCNLFGASRLADAIEDYLQTIETPGNTNADEKRIRRAEDVQRTDSAQDSR